MCKSEYSERIVFYHNFLEVSQRLLATIVHEMFLFHRDSLVFLITLLKRYPVPDKPNVNMEIYRDYDKPIKYLTRRKIIELVLPEFDASAGRQVFAKKIAEMTT